MHKSNTIPNCFIGLLDDTDRIVFSNMQDNLIACEIMNCFDISRKLKNGVNYYIKNNGIVTINRLDIMGKAYKLCCIEKLRCLNNEFNHLIFTDAMTKLYNRNFLEHMTANPYFHRYFKDYMVIFIDIDELSRINDQHGHLGGDIAVRMTGGAIKENMREQDIAVRYAGDEFLLLLQKSNDKYSSKMIKNIRESLGRKAIETGIVVSISAGCTRRNLDEEIFHAIKRANKQMYNEKMSGEGFNQQLEALRKNIDEILVCTDIYSENNNITNMSCILDELLKRCQESKSNAGGDS